MLGDKNGSTTLMRRGIKMAEHVGGCNALPNRFWFDVRSSQRFLTKKTWSAGMIRFDKDVGSVLSVGHAWAGAYMHLRLYVPALFMLSHDTGLARSVHRHSP